MYMGAHMCTCVQVLAHVCARVCGCCVSMCAHVCVQVFVHVYVCVCIQVHMFAGGSQRLMLNTVFSRFSTLETGSLPDREAH